MAASMETTIEGRTNELIAQARGEPVKPSVLVEWNGRKNVEPEPASVVAS
jgi:1-acyl-sn-glycerol-3-phosphate acyltransferase